MCLLDTNIPPERFNIDAVDVSARSLAAARLAIYGKNAFRGKDLAYRDKYFLPGKRGHVLNDAVRSCVRFQQDNLLTGRFLLSRDPYHFIFCRNVLIYFDRHTQRKVIEALHAKLSPSGLLFVGPAEVPIVLDNGFEPANLDMAFACRKAGQIARPKLREGRAAPSRTKPAPPTPFTQPKQPTSALNGRQPHAEISAPGPDPEAATDLETARKLADAGNLSEAATICETHIRQQGPTAQACFLLGLVHDAGGDPRAADYYRKALYLDPEHHDALWHMALLLKKNGQDAEASGFRRRAERAQKKT